MVKKILVFIGFLGISWQAFAFDLDQIQIHGFASQGYLLSNHYDYLSAETEKGTVEFNEFGLNVASNLTDRFRLGMQIFARDLGDIGNDKLTIDWAFGDYRYRNWIGVRFGKLKRALGLYNQSRDVDAARDSVFLPLSLYNESYRSAQKSIKGIGVYGVFSGGVAYQIQYGTLDSDFEEEVLTVAEAIITEVEDDASVLYLEWNTPIDGLKLVGTFNKFAWTSQITRNEVELVLDTDFREWLVGVEYIRGNLTCAAEYDEQIFDAGLYDRTNQLYYGLLSYRFTDWMILGTSYAVGYEDKEDKEGHAYENQGLPGALAWYKDLALSVRFDLNEYWIVKIEGHWINGLYGVSGYEEENPSEDGFLVAAKMTVSF